MTEPATEPVVEKTPLSSKKFIAYQVAEVSWKVALVVLLIMGIKNGAIDMFLGTIALAIVIVAGAIEALYIGGQAGLDKYTRIAQIAARAGQSFKMKDVETQHPATRTPSPVDPEEDTDEVGRVPATPPGEES